LAPAPPVRLAPGPRVAPRPPPLTHPSLPETVSENLGLLARIGGRRAAELVVVCRSSARADLLEAWVERARSRKEKPLEG